MQKKSNRVFSGFLDFLTIVSSYSNLLFYAENVLALFYLLVSHLCLFQERDRDLFLKRASNYFYDDNLIKELLLVIEEKHNSSVSISFSF